MKTALYIEDGLRQAVFTAESDVDQKILDLLEMAKSIEVKRGGFYACQGGWHRQKMQASGMFDSHYNTGRKDDDSVILVCRDGSE